MKQELEGVRLQIRASDQSITAHLWLEGHGKTFVASINKRVAENHPELFEEWKAFATKCMQTMVADALKIPVEDVAAVFKTPQYPH